MPADEGVLTGPAFTPAQSIALLCRILARQGYDDKLAGHVSVRDGEDDSLLVTPVGTFWRSLRARHVLRIDFEGRLVEGADRSAGRLNPTVGFHAALHRERPDIRCAIHNHPPYGAIWAAAAELPPLLDQTGANGGGRATLCHEYEGALLDAERKASLARAYGDADMAILAQHGVLVSADTIPLAVLRAVCFEWRCQKAWEVASMGREGVPLPEDQARALAEHAALYADMLFAAWAAEEIAADPAVLD